MYYLQWHKSYTIILFVLLFSIRYIDAHAHEDADRKFREDGRIISWDDVS
jgi:hypothetical protein